MSLIHKYAAKYAVNPALLISEITMIDKVNVDETILEDIAKKLKSEENLFIGKYKFNRYFGNEQG